MATNSFAGTDVPTLYRIVMSGKPDTLTKMANAWTAVGGVALGESSDMTDNLDTLQTYWQSPVARDAYSAKVRQGIDAMAGASTAATPMAALLTTAATALTTAQKNIAPIYQQYVALLAQIQQSASGTNPALIQQLQQLQQQAAQVVQTLSDAYTTAANGIKPIADPLAGSTTNGQNDQSSQNGQQSTGTATTATANTQQGGTQSGTTQNGATGTNQPTATPAGLTATTTPTAAATATPTTGTLGSVGSVGDTGGVTIPPVTTTPVGTTPISTPITPIGTVLPLTPVSKGSGVGGVSEDIGVGGLPGEVLPVAALPGETLPGGAVPDGTAAVAEPGLAAAETGTAENGMMMPFMPGGMGGFPSGGTRPSGPRRPGSGLFDEEVEPDGRIGPGGVIEADESVPVLPYGMSGAGRERDRKRRPGGRDGWDDGAAVAPAVLVADPVPHR